MARPQGITDEEVLAAARAVFSSKGISATVEEVAERCHVGVATIFRRFPSKQALFAAAVNVANDAEWARFLARHAEQDPDRDPRESLIELANMMLDSARKMMPLIMMRMANPSMMDHKAGASRASWIVRALTDHFRSEIAAGRMNAADPRVAARIWLGSIRHIVMFETLGADIDDLSTDAFIAGLADMFVPAPARKLRKK
jgi:AcrR family transcriptional regulator